MWVSRNFIFHYSLGKHTLVKGVSLLFIFLGMMKLCDNNEGLHFFGVSLTRHTFFKGVLKMKKILSLLLTLTLVFVFAACSSEKGNTSEQNASTISQTESKDTDSNINSETTDSDTTDKSSSHTYTSSSRTSKPTEILNPIDTSDSSSKIPTNNDKTESKECLHLNRFYAPTPPTDRKIYPYPTCTEEGYYAEYCPDCNTNLYYKVKAYGHYGGEATCIKLANCIRDIEGKKCNEEYGSFGPHTWLSNGKCQWCSAKKDEITSSTPSIPSTPSSPSTPSNPSEPSTPSTPSTPTYTDVLIIKDASTISNKTIDTDVYITSSGKVTFKNVTVNGNIYCYGQLTTTGTCSAKGLYAYKYGSMLSCGAFDGTHGKVTNSGKLSCVSVVIKDDALNYAFNKWGKK